MKGPEVASKRRARPKRRTALSGRRREPPRAEGAKPRAAPPHTPIDADRYPNLAALEAWDREQHIKAAMGMGLTREQAERHVEEELADGHLA